MRLSRRIIVNAFIVAIFNSLIIFHLSGKSVRSAMLFLSSGANVSNLQHESPNVKDAEEMEKYGQKLNGVDIYVIEMDERRGNVQHQAETYKIPVAIHSVPATTPHTQDFGAGEHIYRISEMCFNINATKQRVGCPCKTTPKEVACTWSHLSALHAACTQESPQDILLVLEDDANFEPIKYWEESLVEMLSRLPSDWRIVNAAVTNGNNPEAYGRERFRKNLGMNDFGSVAVVYNMKTEDTCEKVTGYQSPGQVIENATEPCQPADMFLFDEFKGQHYAYTSHMPLFYFCKDVTNSANGAIHGNRREDAIKQRDAWKQWEIIEKSRQV